MDTSDAAPGRDAAEITEDAFRLAQDRARAVRQAGHAVSASYDPQTRRVVVVLHNGIEVAVPVSLVQGLSGAGADDLSQILVSPAGLGLHWPRLDVDVYVPGLLQGVLGSNQWLAAQLGASGGKARTRAKADAARANGRKGGRPRREG